MNISYKPQMIAPKF